MSKARALFAAQIYVVWHTVKGPAGHSFHENGLPLENEWDRLAGPCEDFYEEVVIGDPRKQHIEFVKTLEGLPPGATLAQVEALSIDNLKARAADFIGRLTDQEAKTQREAEYKELPDYRVDNEGALLLEACARWATLFRGTEFYAEAQATKVKMEDAKRKDSETRAGGSAAASAQPAKRSKGDLTQEADLKKRLATATRSNQAWRAAATGVLKRLGVGDPEKLNSWTFHDILVLTQSYRSCISKSTNDEIALIGEKGVSFKQELVPLAAREFKRIVDMRQKCDSDEEEEDGDE